MSLIPPSAGTTPPKGNVEQNELAAEYRKTVIEIQSQLFDKAATYSNLIMVAGYAGAFAIWSNVKAALPPRSNILIATLLGISLSVFIAYQVYKMSAHVAHFRQVRALLRDSLPLQEFFDKYNQLHQQERKYVLQTGALVSAISFLVCVIPAVLAIALLFYNFIAILIGLPVWPR